MSAGWLPWLGVPLSHGPLAAAVTAFAISPGIPILLARTLEQRWLRPREQFVAFIYGDPLLAVATGTGTGVSHGTAPTAVASLTSGAGAVGVVVTWLVFGLWQWWDEVRSGYFLPAQAVAPTKVWHQLLIYPVLGYLGIAASMAGLTAATHTSTAAAAKALIGVCVLAWLGAHLYDRRHPKLGHPPYDWRRLRPAPHPWPRTSTTLLAAATPPHQGPWEQAAGS
ncbi:MULTISPECIES: hypothetical protein [unclassified Frankia]|uniref:hypothetical protein n=1 Tax=unclassified Frankia TaxID=2632575 RepID=UPI002AD3B638|nr:MULTISPECIES: hypothetical protein [unclassified Frankia]